MATLNEELLRAQPPRVETISLVDPYVPIFTPQGTDNPRFIGGFGQHDLVVYSSENGGTVTPATFALPGPLNLKVRLIFPEFSSKPVDPVWFWLNGKVDENPRIQIKLPPFQGWRIGDWNVLDDLKIKVSFDDGGNMPWGIRGNISWTLEVRWGDSDETGIKIATFDDFYQTPVELYCISPKLPFLYLSGVPLGLLQLFVEPACKLSTLHSLDEWVAWVTRRCHNSLAKEASGVTVPGEKAIHHFQYNTNGGAPKYTGAYGGGFNLNRWLHNCLSREEGLPNPVVNCYDQAGMLQLAGLLGVPNGKIGWEHKKPFGYLNNTDLVGWGKTNNPWYAGDENRRFAETDAQKIKFKASFGNHSFLSYTKENGDIVALDACAGPVTGTESVTDYLNNAIYHATDITTEYYKKYFGKYLATNEDYQRRMSITALDRHLGHGIDQTFKDSDDRAWDKRTIKTYADLDNLDEDKAPFWTTLASWTAPAQARTQPKRINLTEFLNNFADKARAQLGTSSANAKGHRQKPTVTQLGDTSIAYQCGLDIVMPGESAAAISLTLRVLDTADNALADLNSWLKAVTCDLSSLFEKLEKNTPPLGNLQLAAKAGEPHSLNIFLYENMVVRITALDYNNSAAMATAAEALLVAAAEVQPPHVATTTAFETVKEWDTFSLVVYAPDCRDVEVLDDESRLFRTTKTQDGDRWTFTFQVQGRKRWTDAEQPLPENEKSADDVVIFGYAKDMEMLPSWISVSFTILADE